MVDIEIRSESSDEVNVEEDKLDEFARYLGDVISRDGIEDISYQMHKTSH